MNTETCRACGVGQVIRTVLETHVEDLGGLVVNIRNGVIQERCDKCGEETTEIPDLQELVKAAALARLLLPVRLSGREIRFLRRALEMNGKVFADAMEVDAATLSRWENGDAGIGGFTEKLLRHNVAARLHKDAPGIPYDPEAIAVMKFVKLLPDTPLPPLVCNRSDHEALPGHWSAIPRAA